MSDSNKLVLTAIIGILVGLILGRILWYSKTAKMNTESYEATMTASSDYSPSGQSASVNESELASEPAAMNASINNVSVGSQPAGDHVLTAIVAEETLWVVVRDSDAGMIGKVLGAKHFGPGSATVEVSIKRKTEAGHTYAVVLEPYNSGTLDLSINSILKDSSGASIMGTFTAQ